MYDRYRQVSEHTLRETSTGEAPWVIIEGADPSYRYITVGSLLLEALGRRLAEKDAKSSPVESSLPGPQADSRNILNVLDYKQALTRNEYEKRLEKQQGRLNLLTRDPRFHGKSLIAVFEGQDAAGKGSAIRRITARRWPAAGSSTRIAAP